MQNTPKEWALIQKIKTRVQRRHPHTIVGLGDDAFVFKNFPGYSVLCQDMMVEGTHFDLNYFAAFDVGYRALAVNFSDIAAMGAHPRFVQVSLGLPAKINESWLDQFYEGMCELADKYDCEIVGGDICASPHLVIDVSVHGTCDHPLRRHGAKPGDILLASGPLGISHVGLWALQKNITGFDDSKLRHLLPEPRLDLVSELQNKKHFITALMDCSDGLINDASQMGHGLGLILEQKNLVQHEDLTKMALATQSPAEDIALWGGEDYQLLLSVAPENQSHFPDWIHLGQWQESPGFFLRAPDGLKKLERFKGWSHF